MKKIIIAICFILFAINVTAQNDIIKKVEVSNDLTEVSIFYENGTIMQHGFYTKEGLLDNTWESYNIDGSKKCIAYYKKGVKIGVWTYWNKGVISKVTYKDDKIISIKEFQEDELLKNEN